MLKEIHVYRGFELIYWRIFVDTASWDVLYPILESFNDSLKSDSGEFEGYKKNGVKVAYSSIKNLSLLFIFVVDLADNDELVLKYLQKLKSEFLDMFSKNVIQSSADLSIFKSFNAISDFIFKELRPKIAIVGFGGVGKTTISKLIMAEEIPKMHDPTIIGDIYTVKVGNFYFTLWDFAGQEKFSSFWPKFIKDSNAVLIVTDSTLKNIEKSRYFIKLTRENVPSSKICVIANKQDLPDTLTEEEIEKILKVKTHGMIAIEPKNRRKMVEIIAETLEISTRVSSLIHPLFERDKLIDDAEDALVRGDFNTAIDIFKKIAKYSNEINEPEIGAEFMERARLLEFSISSKETNLPITSPEITMPKVISSKIYNAIDFCSNLLTFFNTCQNETSLNNILFFLKELKLKLGLYFPHLKISESITKWFSDLASIKSREKQERIILDLQFDTLNWLESIINFIEMDSKIFYQTSHINENVLEKIRNGINILNQDFEAKAKQYSKNILISLIISNTISGIRLYDYNFSGDLRSPDLISGFLKGFQSIGREVTQKDTTMKKLSYEDFEVELLNGEFVTAVLITSGFPNQYTTDKLNEFLSKFEIGFQQELKKFDGRTIVFENSEELIKEIFNYFFIE